jgi:hypothetical protein
MEIGTDPTDDDIIGGIPLRQIKPSLFTDEPRLQYISPLIYDNWHTEQGYAFVVGEV